MRACAAPGPIARCARADFDAVVRMLAEGFTTRRGRRGALIHHDAVHHVLRGRRGARLTALTSGGTIPDTADYQVLLEPENHDRRHASTRISPSRAWRATCSSSATRPIASCASSAARCGSRTRMASRRTFPFWLGEAPAAATSFRPRSRGCAPESPSGSRRSARTRAAAGSTTSSASPSRPREQLVDYLAAAPPRSAACRRRRRSCFERFFDEAGGMQLVIHSPFGSRINRAWGLALRKRFCRKFNFELQAAATEDNIVLSLTTAHSFELDEVARYLHSASVRSVLIQALLDAPMFTTRWRWVAGVALALPRFRGGKQGAAATRAHGGRGSPRRGVSRPDRLRRKPRRRARSPRPSAGQPDDRRLPRRGDGHRRARAAAARTRVRRDRRRRARPDRSRRRSRSKCCPRGPTPSSTMRRSRSAALRRSWRGAGSRRRTPADLGRLDPEAIARVRAEAWPDAGERRRAARRAALARLPDRDEVAAQPRWSAGCRARARQAASARLTRRSARYGLPPSGCAVPRPVAGCAVAPNRAACAKRGRGRGEEALDRDRSADGSRVWAR